MESFTSVSIIITFDFLHVKLGIQVLTTFHYV